MVTLEQMAVHKPPTCGNRTLNDVLREHTGL